MKCLLTVLLILTITGNFSSCIVAKKDGFPMNRAFYTHKAATYGEQECNCTTKVMCVCCESVNVHDMHSKKQLCLHFVYQPNGLEVSVTLDSKMIRNLTRNSADRFKMCAAVPEDIFSKTCAEVDGDVLNSRYLRICPKISFLSRHEKLLTKFGCFNISSELSTLDTMQDYKQYYLQSSIPSTVKIQLIKHPPKVQILPSPNIQIGPSSTAQVVEGRPLTLTSPNVPITQISIEISPSDLSSALSASEQLQDQLSVGQYPIGQILLSHYPIGYQPPKKTSPPLSNENPTQTNQSSTPMPPQPNENTTTPLPGSPLFNIPFFLQNTTIGKLQAFFQRNRTKLSSVQNQSSPDLMSNSDFIGISNLSDIKEIQRFSEVTVSPTSQPVTTDVANKHDKNDDKPTKIRFPDGSTVRGNPYKVRASAIVNGLSPRIDHLDDGEWTTSPQTTYATLYENPPVLDETTQSISEDLTPVFEDRSSRFPDRIPPVIQDYLREIEELETPVPQVPLGPSSKLISDISLEN